MKTNGFVDSMRENGLTPPADIIADGEIHRFYVQGDSPNSQNGWYVLYNNSLMAGAYGCWKRGISETWSERSCRTLSPDESARFRADVEAAKKKRAEVQAEIHIECREKSARIWKNAAPAPHDHPYLIKKGLASTHGARFLNQNGCLVVPVQDWDGTLHGLQFIKPKKDSFGSDKPFKFGTKIPGHFYPLGNQQASVVCLAEGFATAATIHEATKLSVAVCFTSGNLKHVATMLRGNLPDATLIICADNDRHHEVNTGVVSAKGAAESSGGVLAIPQFPVGVEGTDFNDLAVAVGLTEVKKQIEAVIPPHPTLPTLNSQTVQDKSWEEPLLFGECQAPDISCSLLPTWLGEYASAVAKYNKTPDGLAAMLAISTVATCLQKRFVISPYQEESYKEPLNIWTLTCLPPASRKTQVIEALIAPINDWERAQAEILADEIVRARNKRKVNLARMEKLVKQAANAEDVTEREKLLSEIEEIEKDTPEEIRVPRLWTGDVTPERLQSLLAEHGEKMSLLSDESAIFEIMAGMYNKGKANLDVFLQAHAGKSMRVDRATRSAHLDSPALTFGLAVQPAVISDFDQGSKKKFRGNGALARFLYCLPPNNIGRRVIRERYIIDEYTKANYHHGISRLLDIQLDNAGNGKAQPRRLTLDPEALDSWLTFAEKVEVKQGPGGEFESIQDWTGKLPGAVLRIAGLFHVVEHGQNSTVVNSATLQRALDLAEILIEHTKAAFDLIGAEQSTDDAKAILDWLLCNSMHEFTKTEVRRALKGRWAKASDRLDKAIGNLLNRDIIGKPVKKETKGRHAVVYPVNPHLYRNMAA